MAKLKRIGVLKASAFLGLFGVFVGIILGLFFVLFVNMLASFAASFTPSQIASSQQSLGAGDSIILILFSGIITPIVSFILGLIFVPLANLVLKIIRGIDIDISTSPFIG